MAIPRGQRKRAAAPTPSALPASPTCPAMTGETQVEAAGGGDGFIVSFGGVTITVVTGRLTDGKGAGSGAFAVGQAARHNRDRHATEGNDKAVSPSGGLHLGFSCHCGASGGSGERRWCWRGRPFSLASGYRH